MKSKGLLWRVPLRFPVCDGLTSLTGACGETRRWGWSVRQGRTAKVTNQGQRESPSSLSEYVLAA